MNIKIWSNLSSCYGNNELEIHICALWTCTLTALQYSSILEWHTMKYFVKMKDSRYSLKTHKSKKYLYQNFMLQFKLISHEFDDAFFHEHYLYKTDRKYRFIVRSALNIFSTAWCLMTNFMVSCNLTNV